MQIEEIAQTCHEVNRAICETFGDDTQKPWEEAEQWQRDSAIQGVLFAIDFPDATPEDQHDAWSKAKLDDGWCFGPVKDADLKEHPCLVPYDELPPEQRVKDATFRAVVASLRGQL